MDAAILKAAAERISNWSDRYGIFGDLYLNARGVTIRGSRGADHVVRTAAWFELEQARYPADLLEWMEEAVLRGLSD